MILDYLLSVQGLDDFSQKIFDGLSALVRMPPRFIVP